MGVPGNRRGGKRYFTVNMISEQIPQEQEKNFPSMVLPSNGQIICQVR